MQKKCYIFDYDGTLSESCTEISVRMTAKIVLLARHKKIIPVVMSGTDNKTLLGFMRRVRTYMTDGNYFYLAGNCGADIVKVTADEVTPVFRLSLTPYQKKEIYCAVGEVIDKFNLHCDIGGQVIDRGNQITLSCIGRDADSELKAQWDPDCAKRKNIAGVLDRYLDYEYSVNIAGTTSIDILGQKWDKGYGVNKIAEIENLQLSEILFFGDKCNPGGNDYPATRVVDYYHVENPNHTLEILSTLNDNLG
ncbi:HAD-IIB family hydrolase [Acinetobacter baumannii]